MGKGRPALLDARHGETGALFKDSSMCSVRWRTSCGALPPKIAVACPHIFYLEATHVLALVYAWVCC